MAKPTQDPLIKAIDEAFMALLVRANGDVTVQPEGAPVSVAFAPAEQIKALEAAVVWAEKRAKITPKDPDPGSSKPQGSPFDGIRNRVSIGGKAAQRRAGGVAEDGEEGIH